MMDGLDNAALAKLIAKDAVRDVLFRYCRAVDRGDEAGLRACYWPDGTDAHGAMSGPVENFLGWAAKVMPLTRRAIHQIHNILLEVKDDGVLGESYFSAFDMRADNEGVVHNWVMRGRYLDWFVERDGEWRILDRQVVFDWIEERPLFEESEEERFGVRQPIGARWPADPVYHFHR